MWKTTLLSAAITVGLAGSMLAWSQQRGAKTQLAKAPVFTATTASAPQQNTPSFVSLPCPMAADITEGYTVGFGVWEDDATQPRQAHMQAKEIVAGISNGEAACKYSTHAQAHTFSIILPGSYADCVEENDEFVGFICPEL